MRLATVAQQTFRRLFSTPPPGQFIPPHLQAASNAARSSKPPSDPMAELLRKPPANPPALRPAASFIIAATEEGGDPEQYRVLMIQRAARGPFGGLTVYPGGAVEKCDGEGWEELVLKGIEERRGISRAEAEKVLAQKTHGDGIEVGLEYYVGAIRESFEEVGLFMTTKRTINDEEQQQLRKEVHNDATQFKKVFEKGGAPDVGRLVHWANWNTPTVEHKRFRTQFFLTLLPYPIGRAHSRTTSADGTETVSMAWMTPQEALDKFEKGEARMFPPQFHQLTELAKFYPTTSHLRPFVEGKKTRTAFERGAIQPEFYKDGHDMVAVMPGDPLHSSGAPAHWRHRLVLDYGNAAAGQPGGIKGMTWVRKGGMAVSCEDPDVKEEGKL